MTPWLCISLGLGLCGPAARRRQWDEFMLAVPMNAQLGGIVRLSIAGEYRYLLPFCMLPVVIRPIRLARAHASAGSAQ